MALLSRKAVEARRLGPTLIATFHRSNPPLIWRFDLQRNHSFTLALQGEEGEWELGLTSPKGEFYPVARFANRFDAEQSFARIGEIMADEPRPFWAYFMRGIGIAFLFLLLVALGFGVMVGHQILASRNATPAIAAASPIGNGAQQPVTPGQPPEIQNGVPQSADDVLRLPGR